MTIHSVTTLPTDNCESCHDLSLTIPILAHIEHITHIDIVTEDKLGDQETDNFLGES